MIKSFGLWMEETVKKRELVGQLLRNLGFSKKALDIQPDLNMRAIDNSKNKDKFVRAIQQLPIDKSNQEEMINFAKQHSDSGLRALADIINTKSAESQDKKSSFPAVLPQSNQPVPPPPNKQQIQQPTGF